jgi:hypothetical protein
MLTGIYDRVAPYRPHMLAAFLGPVALVNLVSMFAVAKAVTPGFMLPDMMMQGYTPHEILTWYGAIGETGRTCYAYFVYPLDMAVIMPSYALGLACHLHTRLASSSSSTVRSLVPYLPIMAGMLDVVESTIVAFGAARFPDGMPPSMGRLLEVASVATRFKHVLFASACLVSAATFFLPLGVDVPSPSSSSKKNNGKQN